MCNITRDINTDIPSEKGQHKVNTDVVTGIVTSGGGFSQLEDISAALALPCMSLRRWNKHFSIVSDAVHEAFLKEMIEAGQEEAALAKKENRLDKDGVPIIPVVVDGSWARRSYKNHYRSLAGVVSITSFFFFQS